MQQNRSRNKSKGSFALIMVMLAALLASACSSGNNGEGGASAKPEQSSGSPSAAATQSASDDPYANAPRKISISTFDRGQVSSDEGTYEDNRWVKWIREQSGIDVTIVPVPRNQAQDSLNVLFASGQAPDMVWEYDRAYIGKLVTQESFSRSEITSRNTARPTKNIYRKIPTCCLT